MMSALLHSDSLLTHANPNPNPNPFLSFNGGFTPWEKLESFFTSSDKIPKPALSSTCDESKSNLSRYHVDFVFDSESPNQKISSFDKPNINRYHAESSPDSEIPKQQSPSFAENNSPDHHVLPNQNSPISSSSSGGDDPNQNPPPNSAFDSCQGEPVQVASTMDDKKRKRMISNRESARRSRMRKQKHVEDLRNNLNELKIQTRERSNQLRFMTHQIHLVRRENDRLKAESIILQRNLMQLNQIWQLQQQCSYQRYQHPPPASSSCNNNPMQILL